MTDSDLTGTGWPALLAALRRPGWLLLAAAAPGDPAVAETVRRARAEYGSWLSVLSVTEAKSATDPEVIPDGDGRVSDRLGLSPGGWLLVRPDAYLLARGPALSPAALSDALGRLPLARPV